MTAAVATQMNDLNGISDNFSNPFLQCILVHECGNLCALVASFLMLCMYCHCAVGYVPGTHIKCFMTLSADLLSWVHFALTVLYMYQSV